MHHFSPAFRFDIDKGGCYGTASPLVRWLELHWCPTALFSSSERGAAGMDLQDKCRCVCVRESSGTKRPFQSADGMEKVSIMQTSNQSKTKARMQNILTLWSWNCGWFFCPTGNTADRTGPVLRIRRFNIMLQICSTFCLSERRIFLSLNKWQLLSDTSLHEAEQDFISCLCVFSTAWGILGQDNVSRMKPESV